MAVYIVRMTTVLFGWLDWTDYTSRTRVTSKYGCMKSHVPNGACTK
jgi:hypothetical protein